MQRKMHFYNVDKLRNEAAELTIDILKNYGDIVPRLKRLNKLHRQIIEIDYRTRDKFSDLATAPQRQLLEQLKNSHHSGVIDKALVKELYSQYHMQEAQDLLLYHDFNEEFMAFSHSVVKVVDTLTQELNGLQFEKEPREIIKLKKMLHDETDYLALASKLRVYLDRLVRAGTKLQVMQLVDGGEPQTIPLARFYYRHLDIVYALAYGSTQIVDLIIDL